LSVFRVLRSRETPRKQPNTGFPAAEFPDALKRYAIEMARIILGHSTALTTEIYAEADRKKAAQVIQEIG